MTEEHDQTVKSQLTETKPKSRSHSICDNCQSNFACSRLYMSLKIADSECSQLEITSPNYKQITQKLAAIKHRLSSEGWTYPHSSEMCHYADNIKETWNELDAVINTIRSITSNKTAQD